jgi:aldose 1-epimerase
MAPLVLHDTRSGSTARILPEVGFNCFEFKALLSGKTVDVLDFEPDFPETGSNPSRSGIPLLFPFPNRIRQGRFRWDGRDYALTGVRQDPFGNAIHGFVIDRPWRVTQQGENFAVGTFQLSVDAPDRRAQWPADFLIEVRYEVRDASLVCQIRIANPDTAPLPWGFGTHPYFRVPLSEQSHAAECLIQAPAGKLWELADFLPTGSIVPVSGVSDLRDGVALKGVSLDHVLTDVAVAEGRTESLVMDPQSGLQMTQYADAIFRELVVYTPGHGRSVCLEPYTCVTDAVNLAAAGIDSGWRVIPPGEEIRTWISIHLTRIYA